MFFDSKPGQHAPVVAVQPPPEPSHPAVPGKRDTLMNFEAQVKKSSRLKWMLPLLGVLVVGGSIGAWQYVKAKVDPEAIKMREEAMKLLLKDDRASLDKAEKAFEAATKRDAKLFQATADRALTLALQAADLHDAAAPKLAEASVIQQEMTKLATNKPEGWDKQSNELTEKLKVVKAALDPLQEKAGNTNSAAFDILKPLFRAHADDVAVLRALSVFYAYDGNAEQAEKVMKNARAADASDPWTALAAGILDATGGQSEEKRKRAVATLSGLLKSHPEMLRARLLLSRAQLDLKQKDVAVATLDGVLQANPAHELAKKHKDAILAPPPPPPVKTAPAPEKAPPPGKPGKLPRK
jgi:hypothetical protein